VSQGFEVLRPKADKALPIPCNEWDLLKQKIQNLTTEPWLYSNAGFVLIGASLATWISIYTGAVPASPEKNLIIAWAVTCTCGLVGAACLWFAREERKALKVKATDISTQMELIEKRFERESL
jgi:pheromone shutdown protein TraB